MKKIAVYPGSFDPVTFGHLDIAARAAAMVDELHIVVVHNPAKKPYFSSQERVALIEVSFTEAARFGKAFPASTKLVVDTLDNGLLVDYCRKAGATVLIKGVRNNADLEYELPMARVNRDLAGVETIFLPADPGQGFVSSSLVKQVAELGGSVDNYVPAAVVKALKASAKQTRG